MASGWEVGEKPPGGSPNQKCQAASGLQETSIRMEGEEHLEGSPFYVFSRTHQGSHVFRRRPAKKKKRACLEFKKEGERRQKE